jgi:hypothetical protein
MDPCVFTLNGKVNPITKVGCKETFTNINNSSSNSKYKNNKKKKNDESIPNDIFVKGYFTTLSILAIYILYCMMIKMKK